MRRGSAGYPNNNFWIKHKSLHRSPSYGVSPYEINIVGCGDVVYVIGGITLCVRTDDDRVHGTAGSRDMGSVIYHRYGAYNGNNDERPDYQLLYMGGRCL